MVGGGEVPGGVEEGSWEWGKGRGREERKGTIYAGCQTFGVGWACNYFVFCLLEVTGLDAARQKVARGE